MEVTSPTMEIVRWKVVDRLLQSALELAPGDRDQYLEQACSGDVSLKNEIKSLLTSHRRAGEFLEQPAVAVVALELASDAEVLPTAPLVGQIISHYRILKMIGRGGMGTVWLAERCDGRFERKVAIKFIHLAVLDRSAAERFKREGAILGRLAHPSIAELIDAGLTEIGEPFLVLEYVEGQTIEDYCDRNRLSVDARIRLFLDVLTAVAHAHTNLTVHRDIKPSNVLVRMDGQVKLLDFGIAKAIEDDPQSGTATSLTLEAGTALTPLFAAPEQVSGGAITTATDIYALGVLLYLLLTGQHPAGPGPHSPARLIKTIVDHDAPRPSDAVSSISTEAAGNRSATPEKLRRQLRGDLDSILAKAVEKIPAERYTSVLAFADDLRCYLDHKPVVARPDSVAYRTAKFVRRNLAIVAVGAVAFLAVVTGVAAILIQGRIAQKERDFAFRQVARLHQHDNFLEFLLSDAAPMGKPFTVNTLLDRAEHIIEKQKDSPGKLDLMEWIGVDYGAQDLHGIARPILERAYGISRQSSDPSARASGSCSLALELSRDEDLDRAEVLIEEGLRELPDDPQYALDRVACLCDGSEVARQRGEATVAIDRMETAKRIMNGSPFDSDDSEATISLDLASMYSEAGRDQDALDEFQHAAALMSAIGRDETETAMVLYAGLALELDQVGRPLQAEKMDQKAIEISRDSAGEDAVSAMVLNNYGRVLRELNRLPEAADYVGRAYKKAVQTGDELVVNQSLLELARIYRLQHNLPRAEVMLKEVEPRLLKMLPPGHYALSVVPTERGLIASERKDFTTALRLMNQAIAMLEATVNRGGVGNFVLPGVYLNRSTIHLAMEHADLAEADASHARALLQSKGHVGGITSKLGNADLAEARALAAEGKTPQARAAASQALAELKGAIGVDHPETQTARQLAQ
jgi:serine/threonine protein kinase/tetratricopeptide (TPR) repeat protein